MSEARHNLSNKSVVERLLLELYKETITRTLFAGFISRILLIVAGCTMIFLHPSTYQSFAVLIIASLVVFFWNIENEGAIFRRERLEEIISREGGGEFEDLFIKAKPSIYEKSKILFYLKKLEPFFWLFLVLFSVIYSNQINGNYDIKFLLSIGFITLFPQLVLGLVHIYLRKR